MLEAARKKTRPRVVDLYDIFCGILYVLKKVVASGVCCPTNTLDGNYAIIISVSGTAKIVLIL